MKPDVTKSIINPEPEEQLEGLDWIIQDWMDPEINTIEKTKTPKPVKSIQSIEKQFPPLLLIGMQ